MSRECEYMRERIEESIGREISADERDEIKRHCAACRPCTEYRERLTSDHERFARFAACFSASERRAEERAIAALPAEAPARARRPLAGGIFTGGPRFAHVAAAAIVLIAMLMGIDFFRSVLNGPVPAVASVIERMEEAQTLVYRQRDWSLGRWRTEERGENAAGFLHREWADSTRISRESATAPADTVLTLLPATRRAVLWTRTYVSTPVPRYSDGSKGNKLARFATHYKRKDHKFVRRERREGRNAAVYEYRIGNRYRWTTWVDVKTELPFRVEIVRSEYANRNGSYLYGLDVTDFLPPGMPVDSVAGWTALSPGEASSIYDDFRWNTQLDASYFSVTPPAGYAVTRIDSISRPGEGGNKSRELPPYVASEIAKTLAFWTSLNGGRFPEDVKDLDDSVRVKAFLVARHKKGGIPGDEFRAAIYDAMFLHIGYGYIEHYVKDGRFHYLGRGAVLGDSKRIICWAKEGSYWRHFYNNRYWIAYADGHVVPAKTPPKTG